MGRPKLETPRTQLIQVRLPLDLVTALDELRALDAGASASTSTVSRSAVLVDVLREGLEPARRKRKP